MSHPDLPKLPDGWWWKPQTGWDAARITDGDYTYRVSDDGAGIFASRSWYTLPYVPFWVFKAFLDAGISSGVAVMREEGA